MHYLPNPRTHAHTHAHTPHTQVGQHLPLFQYHLSPGVGPLHQRLRPLRDRAARQRRHRPRITRPRSLPPGGSREVLSRSRVAATPLQLHARPRHVRRGQPHEGGYGASHSCAGVCHSGTMMYGSIDPLDVQLLYTHTALRAGEWKARTHPEHIKLSPLCACVCACVRVYVFSSCSSARKRASPCHCSASTGRSPSASKAAPCRCGVARVWWWLGGNGLPCHVSASL
jgi:hypothetical protein